MAKEEPTQDAVAGIERHQDLGAESIERSPQNGPLPAICDFREARSIDQMRMKFKPAHERIAFAKFDIGRLRKAAHPGAQTVRFAFVTTRKNSEARHTGGIGDVFDHAGQKGFDVFEFSENARETQHWRSNRPVAVTGGFDAPAQFGHGPKGGFLAQIPILFPDAEVIKGTGHESLKTTPIELEIFCRINVGLFRVTEGLG